MLNAILTKRSQRSSTRQFIGQTIITISLWLTITLTLVLVAYDLSMGTHIRARVFIGFGCIVYILGVRYIFKANREVLANYLLILLFSAITLATLFFWGLNTSIGMLALGLVIALSGTLLGSRRMSFIVVSLALLLLCIQVIHSTGIYIPNTGHVSRPAGYNDTVSYICILLMLSFTLWLTIRRAEQTLKRARQAERKLKKQKEALKLQLAQESAKLRANQLKEVQSLYSFAALGQSMAATLHELSNHITVLAMDIENIQETTKISKALDEAQQSIKHITRMVTTVRRRLNNYSPGKTITPYRVLRAALEDVEKEIFNTRRVAFSVHYLDSFNKKSKITGDPLALTHCLAIITKNALEACADFPNPAVSVQVSQTQSLLRIIVTDNGIGIPPEITPRLFTPVTSTKPTGLGAGLFIAKNLARTQLNGDLRLISNATENSKKGYLRGATFSLEIPLAKQNNNEQ